MVFTSFIFVEFFLVVLLALALCRTRWQRQLAILLAQHRFLRLLERVVSVPAGHAERDRLFLRAAHQ